MVALGPRTFCVGSLVASIVGAPLILLGDALAGLAGVVLIIASAISLLVCVGTYLDDDGRVESVDEQVAS